MLKIPKGHERSGIKIKCLKCSRHVGERCPLTGNRLSTCKYLDKHRFNLVFHVPGTTNDRVMKLLATSSFDEALIERAKMKLELQKNRYHKTVEMTITAPPKNLFDLTIEYLNAISGTSELEILNRQRSKAHVTHNKLVLTRFSQCMKSKGYVLKNLDVAEIGDKGANEFLLYLRKISPSEDLQNKHFVAMKTFFNWIIDVKEYKISNPFRKAELRITRNRQAQVITREEFDSLLSVVTPENGYSEFRNPASREKGKNLYRDYLKIAFRLALETGCRAEELAVLKWSHIRSVSKGVELFDITNLKVTRIQASGSKKTYMRPIPITDSLRQLLNELGYDEKRGRDEYVIPRSKKLSVLHLTKMIGRAFNHFIKLIDTGGRKVEFKDLRKTYFTFLTLALGGKAKLFTGHADEKVLEDHYLAKQFIAGNLTDFRVFEEPSSLLRG